MAELGLVSCCHELHIVVVTYSVRMARLAAEPAATNSPAMRHALFSATETWALPVAAKVRSVP